jgi:hypothetical protein
MLPLDGAQPIPVRLRWLHRRAFRFRHHVRAAPPLRGRAPPSRPRRSGRSQWRGIESGRESSRQRSARDTESSATRQWFRRAGFALAAREIG